jgi:hypothetical protein
MIVILKKNFNMDKKYKGCKCSEGYFGETIVTEDNDYNNGRSSILHHCMNCGIDWAVFDEEFGFLVAKYVKSRKEMVKVAKEYIVEKKIDVSIKSCVIAPNVETAYKIFLSIIDTDACVKDTTESNSCKELIPPKSKKKKAKKKVVKKKITKKRKK